MAAQQLQRVLLKERIDHLTKLILTSNTVMPLSGSLDGPYPRERSRTHGALEHDISPTSSRSIHGLQDETNYRLLQQQTAEQAEEIKSLQQEIEVMKGGLVTEKINDAMDTSDWSEGQTLYTAAEATETSESELTLRKLNKQLTKDNFELHQALNFAKMEAQTISDHEHTILLTKVISLGKERNQQLQANTLLQEHLANNATKNDVYEAKISELQSDLISSKAEATRTIIRLHEKVTQLERKLVELQTPAEPLSPPQTVVSNEQYMTVAPEISIEVKSSVRSKRDSMLLTPLAASEQLRQMLAEMKQDL